MLLAGLAGLLPLSSLGAELPPANLDAGLAELLSERLKHEGVGLAAARVLPDARVQLAAAGRGASDGAALSAERHGFEWGSISKTFTALLLADAVVRGELKLEDPIEASLPEGLRLRDVKDQPLRWVDVATHRSGLPRLPANLQPRNEQDPYADYGRAELLAALRAFKPQRLRDESFEYSNFGFGLIGWLLGERSGKGYAERLQQRVLQPLGLGGATGVQVRLRARSGPGLVQGHDAQGQPCPAWHFDTMAGAGALVGTAAQLARYAQAALGQLEHPLKDAFALCLRPHSDRGPNPRMRMGLGWMLVEHQGQRIATHDGGTGGFASSLWLRLDAGRAGLALSCAAVPVTDLAGHLADEKAPLRDVAAEQRALREAREQKPLVLDAAQLAALPGIYAASPQFKLTIRVRGQQVYAQATGQQEFELFARGPRHFIARIAPLEVQFEGEGKAASLNVLQDGRSTPFRREGDEKNEALTLDPALLQPLAGVYALNAGFKLKVRAEGERLFAQASGQGEFELFAKGPRLFFARVTPLEVRFEGERGGAPSLTLSQAGREMRFTRE